MTIVKRTLIGLLPLLAAACAAETPENTAVSTAVEIDFSLVQPLEVIQLVERRPGRSVTFDVSEALVIPEGADPPNVYWFLAYNNGSPSLEDATGMQFTVEGCHSRIGSPLASFTVEALVTRGTLVLGTGPGDRRKAADGEVVQKVSWVLQATGDPTLRGCK